MFFVVSEMDVDEEENNEIRFDPDGFMASVQQIMGMVERLFTV